MNYVMLGWSLILISAVPLVAAGPKKNRPVPVPLDFIAQAKEEEQTQAKEQKSPVQEVCLELDDMLQRRTMSRLYVGLMNRLQMLKMKAKNSKPSKRDFEVICIDVHNYKKEYLELLSHNKLLYDDGHNPKDNHFNDDLLRQLTHFAREHKFQEDLVPGRVGIDEQETSESESSHSSYSDVWPYQGDAVFSPRSNSPEINF